MRIVVLHRLPFCEIHYDKVIDHNVHDVIYIASKAALSDIPSDLRCEKIERPATAPVWEEVLAAVAGQPRPDRVISLSEFELLDAARVRERLDIPGKRPEEILLVRDKVKMKGAIHAAGLRAPRFVPCTAPAIGGAEALSWTGKTILKPRDGACARDMVTFASAGEAVAAVRNRTTGVANFDPEQFEIEEFAEGPVFHVDGVIADGQLLFATVGRYINTPLEYAAGTPLGSVELVDRPDLAHWAKDCACAVAHRTGVFHLEGILSAEGPVFLEIGGRAGAASIVDVFELAHGVQLNEVMLAAEVFGRIELDRSKPYHRPAPTLGWFVFPGHQLGPGGMRIERAERFSSDRRVVRWAQLPDGHPTPDHIGYGPEDSPITGMLQGNSTADLEGFLNEMLKTVKIGISPKST